MSVASLVMQVYYPQILLSSHIYCLRAWQFEDVKIQWALLPLVLLLFPGMALTHNFRVNKTFRKAFAPIFQL